MTKKVTARKLLRASNALLALIACDDLDERLSVHWHWADGRDLGRWQMDLLPTLDSLLYAAETMSIMATGYEVVSQRPTTEKPTP